MNKDSIIGFILIGVLFVGYAMYMQPSQEEVEALQRQQDSIAKVEQQKQLEIKNNIELNTQQVSISANSDSITNIVADSLLGDSTQDAQAIENFGIFSSAANGEEKTYTLENNLIKVILSNKGGRR